MLNGSHWSSVAASRTRTVDGYQRDVAGSIAVGEGSGYRQYSPERGYDDFLLLGHIFPATCLQHAKNIKPHPLQMYIPSYLLEPRVSLRTIDIDIGALNPIMDGGPTENLECWPC